MYNLVSKYKPSGDQPQAIKSLVKGIKEGKKHQVLLGATGTRIDHVLGNISILGLGILSGYHIILMDEHNKITLVKDEMVIKRNEQFGDFVSIIPYTDDTYVTLEGFRFNVENKQMKRNLSLGVSNVIDDDEARITVNEGVAIVIESRD